MVISKSVTKNWGNCSTEWVRLGSRSKRDYITKSEIIVKENILPILGFTKIIRFAEQRVRHGFAQRIFTFDFYCERKKEKWLIDVTMVRHKRLDKAFMNIFKMVQPKLKFGVIHIKKDYTKYIFKEISKEQLTQNTKNIVTRITKDDFVFGRIKDVKKRRKNG